MVKVAFCDDEAKILEDLSVKIKSEFENLSCKIDLYTTENSIELLEYLKNYPVDILFLDIDMPTISGMEIAQTLLNSEIKTLLVFVTGQDALVYKSFKYHPFGFIRKTYFDEEISGVVKSLVEEMQKSSDTFLFKTNDGFNRIKLRDILYFESESNYINLHTKESVYKFRSNMAYRFEYIMGILNTVLIFLVYWCIYKALYGGASEIDGITFSMVTTNFIISLGLTNAFSKNEMFLQDKIKQGTIANELLKPVNFKFRMLFEDLGDGFFKVIFNFLPAVIIAMLFTKIEPPAGAGNFILCLVSSVLGYVVLWYISFIVQTLAFWLFNVWGLITIKNVVVNIFSGALLPLWFMPEPVLNIIKFTPLDSIFFTPVQLYLGQLQGYEILMNFGRQILWIAVLYIIGELLWNKGIKRLVVQGG